VTEGACGKILDTDNRTIVIKQVHRHLKNKAKCLSAEKQCEMQIWAHELLTPANGFSVLYTPRAWYQGHRHQYYMDRIDCSHEVDPFSASAATTAELKLFYEKAASVGIFPCDYELYRQRDGRVALIDFDKFGAWSSSRDQVVFPWGLIWTKPLYPW
jgi:hypothetical protein